jgi:predicted dehydrogenase
MPHSGDTLDVAVVGVGRLGQAHARILSEMPGVRLVGVFDTDLDRAREVADANNTEVLQDLHAVCTQSEAVSVVVTTTGHYAVALQLLESGRHIFIEKPITTTLEDADQLIRIADLRNLTLQVGHIERFNGAVRSLEGMTLKPGFVESHRLASFDPRGTDVSVVHDLMIHDIDLIRHLVRSEITKIDATGVAVISDQIDIANARLQFDNGCVANVTASRISLKKMRKMRLFQRDAYIALDFLAGKSEVYRLLDGDAPVKPGSFAIPVNTGDGRSHKILREAPPAEDQEQLKLELESFIHAVKSGEAPPVTGQDGREALRVSLEIIDRIEKAAL